MFIVRISTIIYLTGCSHFTVFVLLIILGLFNNDILPDTRYAKCCYKMLKHYDAIGYSNWVTDIRSLLYKNGFGYVWESQNVANKNQFIYVFIERLKDQFIQTWRSRFVSNNKLRYYIEYKHSFGLEKYVTSVDILKLRKALVQFRSSSHNLIVKTGRYIGIAREDRICFFRESGLEDEFHFFPYVHCTKVFVLCICLILFWNTEIF